MNDSDDTSDCAGALTGQDPHIPACDLGRRRVAAILRRERPMKDQEWTRLRLSEELCRLYNAVPECFGGIYMGRRKITGFNLLGAVKPYEVVMFRLRVPAEWRRAANLQSRFVRLPFPGRDS